jgi:hypothetical protein
MMLDREWFPPNNKKTRQPRHRTAVSSTQLSEPLPTARAGLYSWLAWCARMIASATSFMALRVFMLIF